MIPAISPFAYRPINSPVNEAIKDDRIMKSSTGSICVADSRIQMRAVITVDKSPPKNPTAIFCFTYCVLVMGSISFIKTMPSSFSLSMFIALNVQPINIAVIIVITINSGFKISLLFFGGSSVCSYLPA